MKNEIAIKDRWNALSIADMLLEENYIVMLSKEEEFTIINFEFAPGGDRNEITFMRSDEYEEEWDNFHEEIMDDITKDYINGTLGGVLAPRIMKYKSDLSKIAK